MKSERTLVLIKPDGMQRGLAEECIRRIEGAGLKIAARKPTRFTSQQAREFREDIRQKQPTIFESLIEYMTEGPMLALIVEGEGAIERVRAICGPTNPKDAPKGTIRGDFGEGDMKEFFKQGKVVKNIIHASGNLQEAEMEIRSVFGAEDPG
jgi:nucleoside-diphosphate kinase